MADRNGHAIGAFAFYLGYFILALLSSGMEDLFLAFFIGLFVSQLGGVAPDIIEPPTWPGHRGFFHYGVGLLSFFTTVLFMFSFSIIGYSVASFSIGYFSHFILDYFS